MVVNGGDPFAGIAMHGLGWLFINDDQTGSFAGAQEEEGGGGVGCAAVRRMMSSDNLVFIVLA